MATQVLGQHVLLGLSVAGLGAAGLRAAGALGARGLPRVLSAAALGWAAAVVQALGLGVVGLGASPVALALAATLTWLLARWRLEARAPAPREELAAWWQRRSAPARAATGALSAVAVGWTAWQLRHPLIGIDGLLYHVALPAVWIQEGSPGALVELVAGLPVANYPVTSEVALTWAIGLSGSWVAASVINVAMIVLLALAAFVGLRGAGVATAQAGLGATALAALPIVMVQLGGPATDLPAVAWLVVAAALGCVAARGWGAQAPSPALLAAALVAAGLAVGTKTTTALPVLCALGAAAWPLRGALRSATRPLAAGAVAAALVGLLWPLRNLLLHGSPLWPFVPGPFGDPTPPVMAAVEARFIDDPGGLLALRADAYLEVLSGGVLLLLGGLFAPLVRRSRAALIAAGVTALAVASWTFAPYTGLEEEALAVGGLRYLLPALAAATAALCLASVGADRTVRRAVAVVLGLALVLSLQRVLTLGFPFAPAVATVLALAAVGAGAGLLAGRLGLRPPTWAWAAPVAAVVAGAALSVAAGGYVQRHADVGLFDAGLLRALPAQQAGAPPAPVAMGPVVVPFAAGDDLAREIVPLAGGSDCPTVRHHAADGLLALQHTPATPAYAALRDCLGNRSPGWRDGNWELYGLLDRGAW
ncbi:MAG TPA: hypothetical protein VGW11_00540 [Solirubrobacteraceae bacterium]|nr:hypothetical protein [Solirubrobacteraceae bacterium]